MDTDALIEVSPGRFAPTVDGAVAFVPHPLPPEMTTFDMDTVRLLAEAQHVVGELAGAGRTLPNPDLLIGPFIRREAVLSSRIEGTVASVEQLALFEARPDERPENRDAREVANYVVALRHGLNMLDSLPVSLRVVREMHRLLMRGVRGQDRRPGEFRDTQNWIGRSSVTPIDEARFVPPPAAEMVDCLNALEKYAGSPQGLPHLVEIALVHYQFETIHPFIDGNGRIGRALITLMLSARGLMPQPLLHLSGYFDRNQREYRDRLLAVSQRGEWGHWLRFFLVGVAEQSTDAIGRCSALVDLRNRYHDRIQKARNSALLGQLVDSLFDVPATDVSHAADIMGITWPAAQRNVLKLVNLEILMEASEFSGRPRVYLAPEIIVIARD